MMTKVDCIAYVESHLEVRYAVHNRAYSCGRTIQPTGAVNHSLGCAQPKLEVFYNTMNSPKAGWAVNAILGDFHTGEGRILLVMPYKARPRGVGSGKKGSWNNSRIQWEVCEPSGHTYAGGTMIGYDVEKNQGYFERMWKMLVAWNVYVCAKLGYSVANIGDHAESYRAGMGGNHADMGHWLPKHGKSMDALRAEVEAILAAPVQTVPADYRGQVTASPVLRCRAAPNTGATITRSYPKGAVVHISQECDGWGYTGDGWVSLDYIKKTNKKEEPEMTQQEVDARIEEMLKKHEENRYYATLEDVPACYRPAVQKLMEKGVLQGYDGGKDGLMVTIGDNTIRVDDTLCRIVTILGRPGGMETLRELAQSMETAKDGEGGGE